MSDPEAIETLARLAKEEATGELVCATPEAEVHIHLQGGRIAWATSSAARFAFTRYVVQQCEIDATAFRELVSECRRENKPLGETLIEWGVASEDQVRSALKKQIVDALDTLRVGGKAETVFLQRGTGYRNYNREFTFTFGEVFQRERRPRRSSQHLPAISSRPPPAEFLERLGHLARNEPDVHWVEHHQGGKLGLRLPEGSAALGIDGPASEVFRGDVDFVSVRGGRENLIGVDLGAPGSVWCGVDPQVVLGAMILALRERLGTERIARTQLPPGAMGEPRIRQDRGLPPKILEELLERTGEVWAVYLRDDAGKLHCLACREHLDDDGAHARTASLGRFLSALHELAVRGPTFAMPSASLMASSPFGWFFGSELLDRTGRQVWLILDPSANQGIGWAILAALLRRTSLTSREVSR